MSFTLQNCAIAAALVVATTATVAQPGPGAGPGPGPGASAPRGGMGPGRMGPRYGQGITPGWTMMTPEERTAHRQAMMGAKSHDECVALRDKHHQDMQARAKERGVAMPDKPRRDACAGLAKP